MENQNLPIGFEELKKTYPTSWHLKKEFIDEKGNKYERGKYVGNITVNDNTNADFITTNAPDDKAPEPTVAPTVAPSKEVDELKRRVEELKELVRQSVSRPQQHVITNPVFQQEKVPFGIKRVDNDVPDDDYLVNPKTYVTVGKGFILSVYSKNGKDVLAPFNQPIYFRREFDELEGDNNRVIPFSQYRTHSKIEAKFIEESPYYGVTIHSSLAGAKSINMSNVDKIESVIYNVNRMDKNALMAYAVSRGLNIRDGEDKLRAAITKMRVAEEMDRDVLLQNKRILNREVENDQFKNASDE